MKNLVIREGLRVYRRGDTVIEFTLERSRRRTIGLTVFPGGTVRVRAPRRATEESVMALVAGRESWILEKQRILGTIPRAAGDRFAPGYTVLFLGRPRTIVLNDTSARRGVARFRRDSIVVDGARTPRAIRRAVYVLYRDAAVRVFRQRMRRLRRDPMVALLGTPGPLTVRLMRRRWGSCFTDRRITLNPELCAASVGEIDYVILHEMCHFREHNHSPRFHRLMNDRMPDWRDRRDRLNRSVPAGFLREPEAPSGRDSRDSNSPDRDPSDNDPSVGVTR
ncbi:MAG: M48 family metallopeptidase [Alkalispirochaeta sp.]